MGNDPKTSVTDKLLPAARRPNVYLADAGPFVSGRDAEHDLVDPGHVLADDGLPQGRDAQGRRLSGPQGRGPVQGLPVPCRSSTVGPPEARPALGAPLGPDHDDALELWRGAQAEVDAHVAGAQVAAVRVGPPPERRPPGAEATRAPCPKGLSSTPCRRTCSQWPRAPAWLSSSRAGPLLLVTRTSTPPSLSMSPKAPLGSPPARAKPARPSTVRRTGASPALWNSWFALERIGLRRAAPRPC